MTVTNQPGWLPATFPVQLVEVTMGDRSGYTVRLRVPEADGWLDPVFASSAGRLPLMPRPEHATAFALTGPAHDLRAVPGWAELAAWMTRGHLPLLDENRYDLGIPPVNLEMDPEHWLPDLIVKAGVLANELMVALDMEEIFPYLGAGSPLDHLHDVLRRAGDGPRRSHVAEWRRLDRGLMASSWQTVTDMIEARLIRHG
ncbi:hypothetical protein [Actinoplanes couchii]|uniref:Uncharacterized protein n=1 Tax=Actinoplanes couchii TaxID=403638 RepID=A0ABQ3XDJ8_9ACTN|nr:hypothetical protein [Actinoplanes couchii]MDR6317076.1 hypothetical protein [Actinoplanes couchii]GID56571.1 hypothetical protein Aco03nite_049750 [Actinoplanes couchii]